MRSSLRRSNVLPRWNEFFRDHAIQAYRGTRDRGSFHEPQLLRRRVDGSRIERDQSVQLAARYFFSSICKMLRKRRKHPRCSRPAESKNVSVEHGQLSRKSTHYGKAGLVFRIMIFAHQCILRRGAPRYVFVDLLSNPFRRCLLEIKPKFSKSDFASAQK